MDLGYLFGLCFNFTSPKVVLSKNQCTHTKWFFSSKTRLNFVFWHLPRRIAGFLPEKRVLGRRWDARQESKCPVMPVVRKARDKALQASGRSTVGWNSGGPRWARRFLFFFFELVFLYAGFYREPPLNKDNIYIYNIKENNIWGGGSAKKKQTHPKGQGILCHFPPKDKIHSARRSPFPLRSSPKPTALTILWVSSLGFGAKTQALSPKTGVLLAFPQGKEKQTPTEQATVFFPNKQTLSNP